MLLLPLLGLALDVHERFHSAAAYGSLVLVKLKMILFIAIMVMIVIIV
jgi:hypothetical protein